MSKKAANKYVNSSFVSICANAVYRCFTIVSKDDSTSQMFARTNVVKRFRIKRLFVAIHLWSNVHVENTFKEPIKYILTNTSERKLTVEVAAAGAPLLALSSLFSIFLRRVCEICTTRLVLCVLWCVECVPSLGLRIRSTAF